MAIPYRFYTPSNDFSFDQPTKHHDENEYDDDYNDPVEAADGGFARGDTIV